LSIPSSIEVSSNSDKPTMKNSKLKDKPGFPGKFKKIGVNEAIKFKNKHSTPDDVPTVVDIDSSDIENNNDEGHD